MKFLIILLLTLAVAVGFVLVAMEDPGYVVLARAPYTVRLPLALFVLGLALAFAVLYLLFGVIGALLRAPRTAREWREKRSRARAQLHTMQGYAGLIEGDWARAEKKLLTHLPHTQSPLLNYLGAAYAAQQRGQYQRRDEYLADALAEHPAQQLAVRLTAARLYLSAGALAESRDELEKIRRFAPKNVAAVRLLAEVYRRLGDWISLANLMPTLARLRAFAADDLAAWEQLAYGRFLSAKALLQGDDARRAQAYKSLPSARRKEPAVVAAYARQLLAAGDNILAEKTLRMALNRGWDASLAEIYGTVETAFTDDQIKLVTTWLKKYRNESDAEIVLTFALARLHRRNRQPNKARELFRQVIKAGRDDACVELAAMLEEAGEKDAALACYRQGMAAMSPARVDAKSVAGELVTMPDVMPVVR